MLRQKRNGFLYRARMLRARRMEFRKPHTCTKQTLFGLSLVPSLCGGGYLKKERHSNLMRPRRQDRQIVTLTDFSAMN
jgi:hypothetical protein